MSTNNSIEIIIAPDGITRIETQGFQGSECRQASQFLEQALGEPQREQLKAEFYAASTERQQVSEGH